MDKKKLITFLLALTMILSLAVGASAAETTEARVPVTLTVVNTVSSFGNQEFQQHLQRAF